MRTPCKRAVASRLSWALAFVVALTGCAPEKPSSAEAKSLDIEVDESDELDDGQAVVARVGGEEVSRQEFNRRIQGLQEFARVRLQSTQRREDLLARLVEFEIMADEAERRGYGTHRRTAHTFKEAMVDLMVANRLRSEVSMADIDDQARADYFEDHSDEFYRPERRRLARLVVDERGRADELRKRWLDKAPEAGDQVGTEFRRFAFQQSQERETGDRGGDAGWWTPAEADDLSQDLFGWEPYTLYGPFEQEGRYVLMMVVEREEAHRPAFEDLEQELTTKIYEERRRQARARWGEGLTAEADVKRFEERFDDIEAPDAEDVPRLTDLPRRAPTK